MVREETHMKAVLRIFNIVIMALSLVAGIFLFVSPTFSFNSRVDLDVKKLSEFVPKTTYTETIDMPALLGTDTIHVGLKFTLKMTDIANFTDGNRDKINANLINTSIQDVVEDLHEPVNLMTEFTIKTAVKSTIKSELGKQIESHKSGTGTSMSSDDIMAALNMDDNFFTNYSLRLYDAANESTATVDSVSLVLYDLIDEAMTKAEDAGMVTKPEEIDATKAEVKNGMTGILTQLKLVRNDNSLKPLGKIAYVYLSEHLKTQLEAKGVTPEKTTQKAGENEEQYADRMITLYINTLTPNQIYQVIGYICLGLLIGIIVLSITWGFLFVFTLIRTFSKKPWTVFGPWFWILGLFQVVLGLGLTVTFKFILPNRINLAALGLPISNAILVPRTFALVPSILYLACIVLAIVYAIFRHIAKKEMGVSGGKKNAQVQ